MTTIRNCNRIRLTILRVSSFTPISVVVHWLEDDLSVGLSNFFDSHWELPMKWILGILSTRIPLALHQFHSDLWDSDFPSTIWFCSSMLRLVGQSTESAKTWVLAFVISIALSHSRVVVRPPISVWSMINFSVTCNNRFTDFRSWFLVNRRFSI